MPFGAQGELDEPVSVARVRPRTSKGITDLLLPPTSVSLPLTVPLRSQTRGCTEAPRDYLAGGGLVRYRN